MRSEIMHRKLKINEIYIINAINDRYGRFVDDVIYAGLSEDFLLLFQGYNKVLERECFLKTDGRTLWIKNDEDWIEAGTYDLNSYIPKEEEAVFIDHFRAIELVKEYDFEKDELIDFLGILLSQQYITEEEAREQLKTSKEVFELSKKQDGI